MYRLNSNYYNNIDRRIEKGFFWIGKGKVLVTFMYICSLRDFKHMNKGY